MTALPDRLLADLHLMAAQAETPDGDGITVNVQLWAEKWIEAHEAALAAAAAADGWRPIAEAPKDGTRVLGYFPDRCDNCPPGTVGQIVIAWEGGDWMAGRLVGGGRIYLKHAPTHWMPLPAAPQAQGEGK